jgi:hypothetical protein
MIYDTITIGAERFALDAEGLGQVRHLQRTDPAAALALARRLGRGTLPDGATLRVPVSVVDHLPAEFRGAIPMSTTIKLADGSTAVVDPRVAQHVASLEGQVAALSHVTAAAKGRVTATVAAIADAKRVAADPRVVALIQAAESLVIALGHVAVTQDGATATVTAADSASIADAARVAILNDERRRRDPSTGYGRYVAHLSRAWQGGGDAA